MKGQSELSRRAEMVVRSYPGSQGTEHFISFETPDRATIFAFARLRLGGSPGGLDDGQSHVNRSGRKRRIKADMDSPEVVFPELSGCALIRELHVYGLLSVVGTSHGEQQHVGFGTRLMSHAEVLAAQAGMYKVAVISGVGTRGYYRKLGYVLEPGDGEFMVKRLSSWFCLRHRFVSRALVARLFFAAALFIVLLFSNDRFKLFK